MNGKLIILQLSNIFPLKNCTVFLITGNFIIMLLNVVAPHIYFSEVRMEGLSFKMPMICWSEQRTYESTIAQTSNCAWKHSNSWLLSISIIYGAAPGRRNS